MKKILVRSGFNPLDAPDKAHIINRNLIGGNVGNLIYANSVFRTLMVNDEVEFVSDNYSMTEKDAPWINESCSAYIIPLADLFRESAAGERKRIRKLVKALKIPCIILGVGIRARSVKEIDEGFSFDDSVKSFVDAMLEKSEIIGLRGELTARYLTNLGYKEDKDFMVIGCPSMFTYGAGLKRRAGELNITKDSALSVNASVVSTKENLEFVLKILNEYKNSVFLPQRQGELLTLYTGRDYVHPCNKPMYPIHITDDLYAQNRVKMFLQAKQWIDFLSTRELSIGCRIHGNIAGILAGTPTVIVPHDMRMRELIEYHKLPHIMYEEIEKCGDLNEILSRVDFDAMFKSHNENFIRYKDFLNRNSIEHIFMDNDVVDVAPYDLALEKIDKDYEIKSAAFVDSWELMNRMNELDEDNKLIINDLKPYKKLDSSSIKTDIKCLEYKMIDRIKGVKHTNLEIRKAIK